MTLEDITQGFDALTPQDFERGRDGSDGWERVDALCDAVRALPDPAQATGTLFAVMERLSAADLGSPGSLVHTLETFPHYRPALLASFRRRPTALTAWMLNRILNGTPPGAERTLLLGLLEQATTHPLADEGARHEARHFLEYQSARADRFAL